MLLELRVTDLGIIDELHLLIGPGLTAITGETGAGKTLITGAIALLAGERADAGIVRDGAAEARVEGRFENDAGDEVVLARVVPAVGRSRAYIDGRLASAAELAQRAVELLDLHAQHAHQALLEPFAQRRILDAMWRTLARDGKLLYATCSIFPEENGGSIAAFLDTHRDARLIQHPNDGQLLPDSDHDGFFYALLGKER